MAARVLGLGLGRGAGQVFADASCNCLDMSNLIKGQEDYAYAWTPGAMGMGNGSDKLVLLDAKPTSPRFGQVVTQVSVGSRELWLVKKDGQGRWQARDVGPVGAPAKTPSAVGISIRA